MRMLHFWSLLVCWFSLVTVKMADPETTTLEATTTPKPTTEPIEEPEVAAKVVLNKLYQCSNTSETEEKKLMKEVIYTQNMLRDLHGSPHLKWDYALAQKARKHVMVMAKKNLLHHSDAIEENLGENIGRKRISVKEIVVGPTSLIVNWYNENKNYYYMTQEKIHPDFDIGHFTCLVWRNVKYVGCAHATAEDLNDKWITSYLVCNYFPVCNVKGAYKYNVPLPINMKKEQIKDPSTVDVNHCCDYTSVCGRYCHKYCDHINDVCCESCKSNEACNEARRRMKNEGRQGDEEGDLNVEEDDDK